MAFNKNKKNKEEAISVLKRGGLVVMPTDTVFGILASAVLKESVQKLYGVRNRDLDKPCIVLCTDIGQLNDLGVAIGEEKLKALSLMWPNPVSVVLPFDNERDYLHRGTRTLAVRIPKDLELRDFLKQTGPLLAPSANTQGQKIASNLYEAKAYFGDKVDFYMDGEVGGEVSTLIDFTNDSPILIRKGAWDFDKYLNDKK